MTKKQAEVVNFRNRSDRHVVSTTSGGWAVKVTGSKRASKTFTTKGEAVTYARTSAKVAKTDVFIHNEDGTIAKRDAYSQDPKDNV